MHEATAKWAAERAKKALDALEAHDKETRRLIDGKSVTAKWQERSEARVDLNAQVRETARVLVKAVLG